MSTSVPCVFWDIESLPNLFTNAAFYKNEGILDLFIGINDINIKDPQIASMIIDAIRKGNKNLDKVCSTGKCHIFIHDLHDRDANDLIAAMFGLSDAELINNPASTNNYASQRIVCDTDPGYDPTSHPYLAGYNSYNYDTAMLSLYLYEAYAKNAEGKAPCFTGMPDPALIRSYNDELFTERFKNSMPTFLTQKFNGRMWVPDEFNTDKARIRKNMLISGRHLDVARLNEKQVRVGLKRLCGMLGLQIKESDLKGNIKTPQELAELIAYNVSDVVNLAVVFEQKLYQGQFELKKQLLETYPDCIYKQKQSTQGTLLYEPDKRPSKVRPNRLCIDSSSAQFAARVLCPYGSLSDERAVSFIYPHPDKAKELGVQPFDVLEYAKDMFYSMYPQREVRSAFDSMYNYYASIRGKNFNASKNYEEAYGQNGLPVSNLKDIPKGKSCIPYFDKDGKPTSCFVNLSIGGIHGSEYNLDLWMKDVSEYDEAMSRLNEVKRIYPEPTDLKKAKTVTLADGDHSASEFLKSGSTTKNAYYKEPKQPVLFKLNKTGGMELNPKYTFTSSARVNHNDFESYYPRLLQMLMAFLNNALGEDRYDTIFYQKRDYGKIMKDKARPEDERNKYKVLREGTKLILNSASGAGDTDYESPIRMNNRILSMRIIGQLFSWIIGQQQAYAGGKVVSTNTDGLYVTMPETINDAIIAAESGRVHINIEPERLFLISKDSNNRLEYDPDTGEIYNANGGSLAAYKGPDLSRSLAHPAIIDWALAQYLIANRDDLSRPFDRKQAEDIFARSYTEFEPVKWLIMYQNIIASSTGTNMFNFGIDPANPLNITMLQHYNRIFLAKEGTLDTMLLRKACASKITPAMSKKRKETGEPAVKIDPVAFKVLLHNGVSSMPDGTDATVKKVTNISEDWPVVIANDNLYELSDAERSTLINAVDIEKYIDLLGKEYSNNWRNAEGGRADNDDGEEN